MTTYQKAVQKGRKKFGEEFGWSDKGSFKHDDFLSFLDSHSQDIQKAVIKDVRELAKEKLRKIDFGSKDTEKRMKDIEYNEAIIDLLSALPSENGILKR